LEREWYVWPLEKELVFLVNSRKTTNFSEGLSNQKLQGKMTIVLARVSVEIFRPFEMVKWGYIYSENGG
jgi:hypothetical protein